jgi:DNA-binding NarL/FixJ family response regulator
VEEDYALALLSDGVAGLGYLLKERVSDIAELVRALDDVARGGSALDPKVVEGLMMRRAGEASSPLRGLTEKERAVLEQMASGRTNASISRTLYMSERSVEKHISAVFLKLGLDDEGESNRRVMAVLAFVEATR